MPLLLLLLLSTLAACASQPPAGDAPEETSQLTQLSTAAIPDSAAGGPQEVLQPTLMPTATVPNDASDNSGSDRTESPPTATATVAIDGQPTQTPTPLSAGDSLLFLVPQVEPSDPDNPLSDPVIIGYEERRLAERETWVVEPDPFGARFAQAVGALRLQLVAVRENVVVVDLLADERADGAFYPRLETERHTLMSGTCLAGYPLVLDALYSYCFELARSGGELRLSYHLESQSAMPPAP